MTNVTTVHHPCNTSKWKTTSSASGTHHHITPHLDPNRVLSYNCNRRETKRKTAVGWWVMYFTLTMNRMKHYSGQYTFNIHMALWVLHWEILKTVWTPFILLRKSTPNYVSLFIFHLSLMETTLGSTLTPEMRGRQRETESKGGGRIREEEEEVAYELCVSWVWEKRERQGEKSVRERSCVCGAQYWALYARWRAKGREIRGTGKCVCVKGELWCQAWFHYQG